MSVTTPANAFSARFATQVQKIIADSPNQQSPIYVITTLHKVAGLSYGYRHVQGAREQSRGVAYYRRIRAKSYRDAFNATYGTSVETPTLNGVSIVGTKYWDSINGTHLRFYSPLPATGAEGFAQLADPTDDTIASSDSPGGGPPVTQKSIRASAMSLIWDFDLFVVATTDETEITPTLQNAVDNVYVGQAMTKWTFNASGAFINGCWMGDGTNVVFPNPNDGGGSFSGWGSSGGR